MCIFITQCSCTVTEIQAIWSPGLLYIWVVSVWAGSIIPRKVQPCTRGALATRISTPFGLALGATISSRTLTVDWVLKKKPQHFYLTFAVNAPLFNHLWASLHFYISLYKRTNLSWELQRIFCKTVASCDHFFILKWYISQNLYLFWVSVTNCHHSWNLSTFLSTILHNYKVYLVPGI